MEFSELIRTSRAQPELLRGQEAAPLRGTLCVTGHHLLLSPGPQATLDLWLLLLRSVDSMEKRVAGNPGGLEYLERRELRDRGAGRCGWDDPTFPRSPDSFSLGSVITSSLFFYRPTGLRLGDAWHFHPPGCYYKGLAREVTRDHAGTLLVPSLAQLILGPLSRTMAGFQELVEWEWIQASHRFQLHCAHSAFCACPKHEASTFLLFLGCVWQLGRQFPLSLEFGEGLLLALFEHAYTSLFGTFHCNSEKGRCACVRTPTHSSCSGLNQPKRQRKLWNLLYVLNPLAIWPSVEPHSLRLWQAYFCTGTPPPPPPPAPKPSEVAWEAWPIVTDEKTEGSQPMVSASEPQP
ncbi:LOW QUALITY PROTEIN: myotubularin-related protein 9-like [Eptesicus fuscus]|uniref:LOW QUALITY PROTEIN: myotubularin-related protein 9-like n=1 Tax=Eptesicus fuscus TaxID=29078 RepID=UPI002403FEA8|nr:LOW QUALITY PROTEIN: myotubularin-related protein 9-like [Eptesicus fuscus]